MSVVAFCVAGAAAADGLQLVAAGQITIWQCALCRSGLRVIAGSVLEALLVGGAVVQMLNTPGQLSTVQHATAVVPTTKGQTRLFLHPHVCKDNNMHAFCCMYAAGDMNWTDSRDGSPPLPAGWCDVWQQLHPGDPGFTYDSKNNPMLPYKNPGLRLDR